MTYAAAHSGGLGQVNLNFIQTGGEFPFINHLKTSQAWTLADNSGQPNPDDLNSDGYPVSGTAISIGVYTRFFIPTALARSGRYLIRWTGNCTVAMASTCTYVSASAGVTVGGFQNSVYTSTSGSGRVVLQDVGESVLLKVMSAGCSNLQFIHENDEALYDGGEIFGVAFKAGIAEGNIGVIRFLNWTSTNLTTASDWASRKPITYFSYGAPEYRGSRYKATTGTSTAYTMVAPSGWPGLVDKAWVIARFHTNGTGPATLNVAGSGDKPLLNWACNPLEPDSYPKAGGLGHCFYDVTMDAWIKVGGGDVAHGSWALENGIPWELLFRLCAETGTHPHFCIPHYALTRPSDLAFQLATYCVANAPAWMVPTFEPSNEVWNTAFGFNQTYYAKKKAVALGWSATGDHDRWYGYALSCLGQDVAAAFSVVKVNVKTQTKYRVVGAIQTGGDLSITGTQSYRFKSPDFIAGGFTPPSGYAKDPASDWANDFALANYFTPPIYSSTGGPVELTLAAAFDGVRATVNISGTTLVIQQSPHSYACTISNASPGVVSFTNDFFPNEPVKFSAGGGVLPSQLVAGTTYYVSATGLSGTGLSVSATPGSSRINTSGGSGTVLIERQLAVSGKMQVGAYIRGVGVAGALVQTSAKVISGSGDTWTLDKTHGTINNIGVIGGLDWSLVDDYAEHAYDAGGFGLPSLAQYYDAGKAMAQDNGINMMCGYEGGWSPDLSGFATDQVNCLRSAASYSDKIAKITLQAYESFYARSGGGFTAHYFSNYLMTGSIYPSPNGVIQYGSVWAVLQDIYQNPRPPAWIAMKMVNKGGYVTLTVNN